MEHNNLTSRGLASLRAHWKDDLKSGFGISLIALPLSLGIALASGFPPIAGLFAAIVGGLLVSRLNGSHVTITGPAAGLIVVNLAAVETLGNGDKIAGYHHALGAIVVAGILIFIFGKLKAGKMGDFFPTSAVHGMLAAIGVIIIVKQVFIALGVSAHGHELYEAMAEVPDALMHANPEIVVISAVALLILIVHPFLKLRPIQVIPAPMWVLIATIPLELWMDFQHEHQVIFAGAAHKVGPQYLVHLPSNILDGMAFPDFSLIISSGFWIAVISIALVTSIESVLSALAVDTLDPFKRKSDLNKDLSAMGVGAAASGLIGGLPVISEIVRSSANVSNGGKTGWANFFHGSFLLIFLVLLRPIIELIPLSALAAMLIYTGYRLASPKEFKHMYEIGKGELFVFLVTMVVVLLTDLLIGIAAGVVTNLIMNLAKGTELDHLFKAKVRVEKGVHGVTLKLGGTLVFSNYLSLKSNISKHKDVATLILDMSDVKYIDHTVVLHLNTLEHERKNDGKELEIRHTEHLNATSKHEFSELKRAN